MVDLTSFKGLKELGFEGFLTIAQLRNGRLDEIPREQGVYLVTSDPGFTAEFLEAGSGGYFKGRNPNVPVSVLQTNWIAGALVINVGKAGGAGSRSTLRRRLEQYLKFGKGMPIGHYGGRYVWQLNNADQLRICWKVTSDEPRDVERELIALFRTRHGARPFANLQD